MPKQNFPPHVRKAIDEIAAKGRERERRIDQEQQRIVNEARARNRKPFVLTECAYRLLLKKKNRIKSTTNLKRRMVRSPKKLRACGAFYFARWALPAAHLGSMF